MVGSPFPGGSGRGMQRALSTDDRIFMAGHAHVDHGGDKRIALLIAILALFLALAETGAKSAQTEAITRNVEAANLWSFFQARTIRQTTLRTAAEEAELDRLASAEPAFQAAIVLASAAIITAVPALTGIALALGLVGVALTGIGFLAPEAVHF